MAPLMTLAVGLIFASAAYGAPRLSATRPAVLTLAPTAVPQPPFASVPAAPPLATADRQIAAANRGLALQLEALAQQEVSAESAAGGGEAISRLLQGGPLDGVKLEQLTPQIYHLNFPSQYLMAATFLRFQENYESPKFRGKVFDLETYMDWYAETHGRFTYYDDWAGFNIPSRVLRRFYKGEFGTLSRKEQTVLDVFQGKRGRYYIIGTVGTQDEGTLRHEISHGLFYSNPAYRREVLAVLNTIDLEAAGLTRFLATAGGYHPKVWLDEAHAYIGESLEYLKQQGVKTAKLKAAHRKLRALYRDYYLKK